MPGTNSTIDTSSVSGTKREFKKAKESRRPVKIESTPESKSTAESESDGKLDYESACFVATTAYG